MYLNQVYSFLYRKISRGSTESVPECLIIIAWLSEAEAAFGQGFGRTAYVQTGTNQNQSKPTRTNTSGFRCVPIAFTPQRFRLVKSSFFTQGIFYSLDTVQYYNYCQSKDVNCFNKYRWYILKCGVFKRFHIEKVPPHP